MNGNITIHDNTQPLLEPLDGSGHRTPNNIIIPRKTDNSSKKTALSSNNKEEEEFQEDSYGIILPKECWRPEQQTDDDHNSSSPKCVYDLKNTSIFLHVGKGGGGTVERLFALFDMNVPTCHPFPEGCIDLFDDNYKKHNDENITHFRPQQQQQQLRKPQPQKRNVLLNIRDPVYRFQSAFNWRTLMFCHSHLGDNRTQTLQIGPVTKFPHKYCVSGKGPEPRILLKTYNSSANHLAESLCPPVITDKSKAARLAFKKAKKHALKIQHMNRHLVDWIDLLGIRITVQLELEQQGSTPNISQVTNLHESFFQGQEGEEEMRVQS